MNKNEFIQICQDNMTAANHKLSAKILPAARQFLQHQSKPNLPVIWLETNDSGDNNIVFLQLP